MFDIDLKMSFLQYSDICTDHADVADHYCFRNGNPGTLASHNHIKDPL